MIVHVYGTDLMLKICIISYSGIFRCPLKTAFTVVANIDQLQVILLYIFKLYKYMMPKMMY